MKKSALVFALLLSMICVVHAEQLEDDGKAGKWANKDDERVPICECTCFLKNQGGGDAVFTSKIWFKATADTKCENNNGAKCDGKQGDLNFAGKTKDCIKSFVKK